MGNISHTLASVVKEKRQELLSQEPTLSGRDSFLMATALVLAKDRDLSLMYYLDIEPIRDRRLKEQRP